MKLPDAGRIRARYAATVKELTVNYGDNYVLNHAALYVESGKRTFLTGTNGAGKSTLIKAILQHEPGTFITSEARVSYFPRTRTPWTPKRPCWKM